MVEWTLIASATLTLVAGIVYADVARRLGGRRVAGPGRRAAVLFSAWWFAAAGLAFADGVLSLSGAFGASSAALVVALTYVGILLACVGSWALLYYFLYLLTGRAGLLAPLAVAYVGLYAGLVYLVTSQHPEGARSGRWSVGLDYAEPLAVAVPVAVAALVATPHVLGALAYFSVYFRVDLPTQKYRIAVVSWSIVALVGSAFAAVALGPGGVGPWPLAARAVVLAAAAAVHLAYRPPAWVRERYGIESLTSDASE